MPTLHLIHCIHISCVWGVECGLFFIGRDQYSEGLVAKLDFKIYVTWQQANGVLYKILLCNNLTILLSGISTLCTAHP